jgi:hypothetical protein
MALGTFERKNFEEYMGQHRIMYCEELAGIMKYTVCMYKDINVVTY